jgi:hypothetical protein
MIPQVDSFQKADSPNGMNKKQRCDEREVSGGGAMSACNFDRLLRFVNDQSDLDCRLAAYDHLDRCNICRDAVYQLSRDRDEECFINRAYQCQASVLAQ